MNNTEKYIDIINKYPRGMELPEKYNVNMVKRFKIFFPDIDIDYVDKIIRKKRPFTNGHYPYQFYDKDGKVLATIEVHNGIITQINICDYICKDGVLICVGLITIRTDSVSFGKNKLTKESKDEN